MVHNMEQHLATDGLVNLLTKPNHDLAVVQHRLEKEFQQVYPDNENLMKLLSRIKKVQEDLLTLKEQCRELLKAKQMQASVGIPLISDSDDPVFANFNQIVDEWEAQVRSRTERDGRKFLFSCVYQYSGRLK
ncbi:spindle and kinetochore-associated protein 2 isoform X2 [Fagus crenata]